ncbi:MAG: hypothetical protein ACD_37C00538G0001 [uncultured bacterium]|nr:MAG: hypothetical protein ACD_37C00538G0001 [uncultured bacterium]
MTDLKDRGQITPLSVVPGGLTEGQSASAPMSVPATEQAQPATVDASVSLSSPIPEISQNLSQLGVSHGADSFKLAPGVQGYSHNPTLRSLPGGLAFTQKEMDELSREGVKVGAGWMGAIGDRQLKEAA